MDGALAFKAKVDNSYESEPSSGSGSSISENNDYLSLEVDNMNLPSLLKPRIVQSASNAKTEEELIPARTPTYLSSQESPFRGFNESSFEKLKMRQSGFGSREDSHSARKKGVNNLVTAKYYGTIVTEDSCNAVDIPLTSQENQLDNDEEDQSMKWAAPLKTELSFNGKIKSLTLEEKVPKFEKEVEAMDITNPIDTTQFSQSFMVRDYNAEGSPDLFADEEEDEVEVEAENATEYQTEQEAQNTKHDASTKDGLLDTSFTRSIYCPTESSFTDEPTMDCISQHIDLTQRLYRDNCKRERELLRRIRKCLSGVPPPPSLTTPQVDLVNMVLSRKDEILNFFQTPATPLVSDEKNEQIQRASLLKPTHSFDDMQAIPWRDILGVRYHGLSYNLTKASESNEYLGLSVVERFVGSETNSSYRGSPSSAKKRNARLKLLTQSPGNRLSHLAKRRAVFSSAHLATTSQKSASSLGPQIVIDKRKAKHRRKATPKRKTPGSKKKVRKTPSSSARKRLYRCETVKLGPTRETSKRALFQSPAKHLERQPVVPKLQINPEIATRVEKSKRALFSPETTRERIRLPGSSSTLTQPFESLLKRKRSDSNYDDDVDELTAHSSKLLRTSENLTPRALKIKSQSFCIGAGSSTSSILHSASTSAAAAANLLSQKAAKLTAANSSCSISSAISSNSLYAGYSGSNTSLNEAKLQRAHSDMAVPTTTTSLTENQRKKLLWAVSQALQEKKITTKHENFKQYASVLARVVRRIFQEYYQSTSTSNSETMLRLAKKYVYYVVSGRNTDDVYLHVKAQLDESKRMSTNRLTGYIGPEAYQQLKKQQQLSQSSLASTMSYRGSMQNLFSNENSIDTFSGMAQPSGSSQQLSLASHSQAVSINEETWPTETTKSGSKKLPIEPNSNHKNSSSKSNLGSLALRENSGQKNFTGKDQRNISPYAANSALKASSTYRSDSVHAASSAKAKRQILFDS